MNTTFAKAKIEKLMAVALHPTTNQNEAQNAYELAKKVAEKYKVLTWFFLTYQTSQEVTTKVRTTSKYILTELFKWTGVLNNLCFILDNAPDKQFEFRRYDYSKRSNNFRSIYMEATEEEFQLFKRAYEFVLANEKKFYKMVGNSSVNSHYTFSGYLNMGFAGEHSSARQDSKVVDFAYRTGEKLRVMYEEARKGW